MDLNYDQKYPEHTVKQKIICTSFLIKRLFRNLALFKFIKMKILKIYIDLDIQMTIYCHVWQQCFVNNTHVKSKFNISF